MPDDYEEYLKDTRVECKYGVNCYQKNSKHLEKYKHPSKTLAKKREDSVSPPAKRFKNDIASVSSTSSSDTDEDVKENVLQDDNSSKSTKINVEKKVDSRNGNESALEKNNLETIEATKVNNTTEHEKQSNLNEAVDKEVYIKEKFLIKLPNDFYQFWDFCKRIKSDKPSEALAPINLILVGPYDVLAEKLPQVLDDEKYLVHWRYFHDPPEFQTVIKGDDKNGFHIGYFRDVPDDPPVFLASNSANRNGEFAICGENIFAAVYAYILNYKKTADPFKKMSIARYEGLIKKEAEKLSLSLAEKTANITKRNKDVVTKTFNKLGIVVPYDRKSEIGYRELAMNNNDLGKLFDSLLDEDENKNKILAQLQPVFMHTNLALDECDFGTGLELGLNILAHGVKTIDATALRYLRSSYKLLKRDDFVTIAEAHLKNRKSGTNLSVL